MSFKIRIEIQSVADRLDKFSKITVGASHCSFIVYFIKGTEVTN